MVLRLYLSVTLEQKTANVKVAFASRVMQWSPSGFTRVMQWSPSFTTPWIVDATSISNQVAKHRNAVSVHCRVPNVGSTCNAGGSSSLHTRMNAAARLMQPLRCAATHLEISQHLLQHASNTQRTQALARQAQRTAQQARRCSRTCILLTRPRVTRSITNSAQCHDIWAVCISAGAMTSRRHANVTQGSVRRTGTKGGHSAKMEPRGCVADDDAACLSLSRPPSRAPP